MKSMNRMFLFVAGALAATVVSAQAQFIDPVVTLTGSVMNEISREPASVNVVFFNDKGERVGNSRSNAKDGYYLVTGLKGGQNYRVRLEQPNFFQTEYSITVPSSGKYQEITRDFLIKPMSVGTRIPLSIAPFEVKKSKLRVGVEDQMNDLYSVLSMNPSVRIEVQTYADAEGTGAEGSKLSEERAQAIKSYLVSKGIDANRISTKASGDVDPLNPPPIRKTAKGKRYIGSSYLVVTAV